MRKIDVTDPAPFAAYAKKRGFNVDKGMTLIKTRDHYAWRITGTDMAVGFVKRNPAMKVLLMVDPDGHEVSPIEMLSLLGDY